MTWLGALCQIKRAQTKLNACLNLHSGARCPDILAASFQSFVTDAACHSPRGAVLQHLRRVGGGGIAQRVYVICSGGSWAARGTFSYGRLYVSAGEIYFRIRKTQSYDTKMTEHGRAHKEHVRLRNLKVAEVAVDREEVNSRVECSCRSHWGLSETFQMSAVEKGVAAGWRALKMRVFICSWMKPKSS